MLPMELTSIPIIRNSGKPGPGGKSMLYDNKAPAVAFYFSAHWCGPCRQMTPLLCDNYVPGKMEIIFVSLDRDEAEFKRYHQTMPWAAIPFDATSLRETLKTSLKIGGIPALVTVSPDGSILNHNARSAFMRDPIKCPWPEPHIQYLHETIEHRGGDINTTPSAVLVVPSENGTGAEEIAAYESVAGQVPTEMPRFVAVQGKGGASTMVAMAMGYEESTSEAPRCRLSVVDVQNAGGIFYPAPDDLDLRDGNAVALFVANYKMQSEPQSLSR